jgi:hypothetical protein
MSIADEKIQIPVVQVGDRLVASFDEFHTFGQRISGQNAKKSDRTTPPIPNWTDNGVRWAYWGDNDLLPTMMRKKIEEVPIAGAVMDKKIRMMEGNGIMYFRNSDLADGPKVGRAYIPEVEDFLQENRISEEWFPAQCADYALPFNAFSEIVLSNDKRKATGLYHIGAEFARLSKANERNQIDALVYSYHFPFGTAQADTNRVAIPLYKWYDAQNFMERLAGRKFAWHTRFPSPGMIYYARPWWIGLFKKDGWLDVSSQVPRIVSAMQRNQIALKYQILMPESYFMVRHPDWTTYTATKRAEVINAKVKDINEYLSGVDNTGKSLINLFKENEITGQAYGKIEIIAVDDKAKTGVWVPDSYAADSQIVQGFGMDPSQIGLAPQSGKMGAGSGSDKRESYNLLVTLNTPDQRRILEPLNWISRYNKWGVTFMVDHIMHTTTNNKEDGLVPSDATVEVA